MQRLHIIVSCTDRKRVVVPDQLRFRNVARKAINVLPVWLKALDGYVGERLAAVKLYAGDHWKTAMMLPAVASRSGFSPDMWVASAGLGLVPMHASIPPYSATFSPGQPDSIAPEHRATLRTKAMQEWWAGLHRTKATQSHRGGLSSLASEYPRATFLVICSSSYVRALEQDLLAVCQALSSHGRLIIVTSKTSATKGPLDQHVVRSSNEMRRLVGGGCTGLLSRTAQFLLAQTTPDRFRAEALNELLIRSGRDIKGRSKSSRKTICDNEIELVIAGYLNENSKLSFTAALRLLRTNGYACEYHRFHQIYSAVARRARGTTS